jgi:hypothetical protein
VSDLLGNLEAYIRTLPSADVRVVLGQAPMADQPMRADAEANQGGRDLAEGDMRAIEIGAPVSGRFTCFMDGMQRPRGPIYINAPVPIIYGYVAAAIRVRGSDRRMRTLAGFHEIDEALYFPKKLAERHGLAITGVRFVDTGDDETIEHPLALAQAAHDKISTVRGRLESELASRWVAENSGSDEWLLVDGSLQSDYGEAGNIIGVTKSHGTQYLTWDEQRVVLGLRPGERSGAFVPIVRSRRRPVYSWYLRMHPSEGKDVYFGLIRVEAPRSARALGMVDEISRWLLAERAPLSLPDARWDKMIYPIRDCEQFMKSLAPSHTSLDARLMRLGSLGSPEPLRR